MNPDAVIFNHNKMCTLVEPQQPASNMDVLTSQHI
jgi:hypothetical protein